MNVCREPETLSTKCYTNPSICGFSVVFNFSAGIFKARMVTRIYKKSYTAGVSVFVLLFTTDPGIFGPVTEPLSVPQFPQLQNEVKMLFHSLCFFFFFQFWNKRCLNSTKCFVIIMTALSDFLALLKKRVPWVIHLCFSLVQSKRCIAEAFPSDFPGRY